MPIYHLEDALFAPGPSTSVDYANFTGTSTPIVLDNGSARFRAGWASEHAAGPRIDVDNIVSRYKDRKTNKPVTLAGAQVHADTVSKQSAKVPYEGDVVCSFDAMETMLDYAFAKLGIDGAETVPHPVAMTETACNPSYSRSLMSELLFEGYGVPSIAYGNDALSSFFNSGLKDGLIVSSSASGTMVIPVLDGQAILSSAKRLSYGGSQATDFMLKLLQLKYPHFPSKLSPHQAANIVREFTHLAPEDYTTSLTSLSNPNNLCAMDQIIQAPYTVAAAAEQKTQEELDSLAEKRRENMKRMQELQKASRLEKLAQKEKDLVLFKELVQAKEVDSRAVWMKKLEAEGFGAEDELMEALSKTEKSLKRSRDKEAGVEDEDKAPPTFPLIDVADHLLNEEDLKDKRRQKLMKAGYDARERAKVEKEAERQRKEQEAAAEEARRRADPEGWLAELRQEHDDILARMKERSKHKAALTDRKSLAAQNRMKSITNLASDVAAGRKRKKKGGDDMFGANDADWAVYREIGGDESEDEEDEQTHLFQLEQKLLEHDPHFGEDDTAARRAILKNQLLNAFMRGMRPTDSASAYDPSDPAQAAQLHVNIEQIRVPEALYQPQMAGIDQAGLLEIVGHVLKQFSPSEQDRLTNNVFVTGGFSLTPNFDARLAAGLRSIRPVGTEVHVRRAADVQLDAWKGLAKWSQTGAFAQGSFTHQDYLEQGSEYFKPNSMLLS